MAKTIEPIAGLQARGRRILKLIEDEVARLEKLLEELQNQARNWMQALAGPGRRRGRPKGAGTRVRRAGPKAAARKKPGRPGRPPKAKAAKRPGTRKGRPRPTRVATVATAKKRTERLSPAVDWDAVLGKLPNQFVMDDITKATPELEKVPQARVIALARWARAKKIKKTGKGKYRRLAA